jgi:hypothetical protein
MCSVTTSLRTRSSDMLGAFASRGARKKLLLARYGGPGHYLSTVSTPRARRGLASPPAAITGVSTQVWSFGTHRHRRLQAVKARPLGAVDDRNHDYTRRTRGGRS